MNDTPRPIRSFLTSDRTPMWMTLCVLGLGAAGSYFLAPRVNAQFEAQKVRADFVIRNYSDFRTKMEDFQGNFLLAIQKLVGGESVKPELYKLQDVIGRINAQALSFMPLFTTSEGPKAILDLMASLNAMLSVLRDFEGKKIETEEQLAEFNKQVAAAGQGMAPPLLELYVRIGEIGNLSPTEKNTNLKSSRP